MPELATTLRDALAGRYRLEEEIGSGGMATVFRAEDLKHGRTVAVKVLRPELVPLGREAERFHQEIRIAARLTHPGILPLHDSGELDGLLYYVMPFATGESLRDRMDQEGRLPVEDTVRIVRSLAAALDYAHRQGVVHRDIKPDNILFQEGEPVLADFGIARALAAAADQLTERGVAIGTPDYMSPEQASGDSVDGGTDQYALACVAYEMLAGRPPFSADSTYATLMQHLTQPPAPLRDLRPSVPSAVDRAIFRALAKERTERFATMADFAKAMLQPTLAPVAAMPPARERAVAVLPFENASPDPDNEYLSDGITDELINALTSVRGLQVASRTSTYAYKGKREDVRTIGAALGVTAVLEGTVRRQGERVRVTAGLSDADDGRQVWSARFDRSADDLFLLEEELARTIVDALRSSYLGDLENPTPKRYTESLTAHHLYLKGRHAWNRRSAEGIQEAIRLFEAAIAADPGYALAYTGLADSHALQVDYRGAPVAEGMRRAREEAERALALDEGLAEAHTSLAWVTFIHDWNWAKASHHFRRAIELNPRYPTARQWYAWLLLSFGRVDEAVLEGRMARDLDPTSVSIRRGLGWLYLMGRRPAMAITVLEEALEMNPVSDETQWVLGLSYLEAGRYDEAEPVLTEAHTLARGENFHAFAALGRLAVLRGRRDEAVERLHTLNDIAKTRYVSPVDFTRLHLVLGEYDEAFRWLDRAYEERRGWLAYLRVEPWLDPVRGDPRFKMLLRRMQLD